MPSLRAKRRNLDDSDALDCFVASLLELALPSHRHCERSEAISYKATMEIASLRSQ